MDSHREMRVNMSLLVKIDPEGTEGVDNGPDITKSKNAHISARRVPP